MSGCRNRNISDHWVPPHCRVKYRYMYIYQDDLSKEGVGEMGGPWARPVRRVFGQWHQWPSFRRIVAIYQPGVFCIAPEKVYSTLQGCIACGRDGTAAL
jgi:hypothetical protein